MTHSRVLLPHSNVRSVVSASFVLVKCFFRTPRSLFVRVRFKKPLFLCLLQHKKHTTDSSSSYYYDERERVPFSIHLLRTTKRTETMKFSRFSFFAFATLFFHRAARVDVVQAAPAMMFFSPPPVARRHLVKEEEEEKATAFSSMHSKSSKETEDNVALYAGRVQNERMVLEKLLVGGLFQSENDDDDDEMKAEVTIVLDQPRWTAEDDEQMAKFLSFSKSSSSTVSSVFAPRFSRFRGGGKQTQQQQQRQHAVKEEIEKRFSVASTAENSRDENSLGGRVRYWNCDDEKEDFEYATRTTTTKTDELDERVKAILGDLTRRSKEDKEPTDRVGIVMCGGEDKEDDLALFRALMKALGAAERTFVAGVLGGETAGRVEGSGNSGGNADCTRDAEKREKRRDLLFSKGSGSQVNECDDLCQLHVSIVSGLIIFWIFAGTFTYGMGMMSNLDTPKIYEKSDE